MANKNRDTTSKDLRNEDPITGEPGSHPVGTGIGDTLGGAAAGAAGGAVGGPVGAVIGAAVGAVAGGFGGKAVSESIDPTVEDAFWREQYRTRSYYDPTVGYETYQPAYRTGWESYDPSMTFEEREAELRQRWEVENRDSNLSWNEAREAMRDSWSRIGDQYYSRHNAAGVDATATDASRPKPK